MVTGSSSHRKRPLSWFLRRIGMISLGVLSANGQQADQLQQQLQQLKQQYDSTTRDLEQRIATLEQEIEKQKEATAKEREATVSASQLAAEQAAKKVLFGGSNRDCGLAGASRYFRVPRILSLRLRTKQRRWTAGRISGPGSRCEIPLGKRGRNLWRVHLCQQLAEPRKELG